MRRIVMCWMLVGLVLQFGCDRSSQQTAPPVDEAAADGPAADFEFTIPATNAIHPIAGRSAFPEQDEDLQQPIAAKRLSDNDPFAYDIGPAEIPDIVPWDEAKKYVGYEITVEGKIVDIGQSNNGRVNFLNFHKDWRGKFYMVVFDDLAKTLPEPIEQTFRGKTLRVRGMVEEHRGNPQIKILSMDQVEFIGG